MVSRNASKSFTKVGKSVSLSKDITLGVNAVNRCKAAYFYVIQKFRGLEAGSVHCS
jgi:hypothetical protein